MPYNLPLGVVLRRAGWRVTIYDAEGPEEPHVTIHRRGKSWRISLRTGRFLDRGSQWRQIDKEIKKAVQNNMEILQREWDELHDEVNPISSDEE